MADTPSADVYSTCRIDVKYEPSQELHIMSWTGRGVRKQMRRSRMSGAGPLNPISCATRTSLPNIDSGRHHRMRARLHLSQLRTRPNAGTDRNWRRKTVLGLVRDRLALE